jgi:hypothetical protein
MKMNTTNLPIATSDDGFDETEINDRVIQGTLLKCVDGKWTDRDGSPAPETPLLALSTATIVQHWQDQRPIETIVKRPGHPFPGVDDLNAQIPQSVWEEGFDGKPRPPWQLQKIVYLLCEETAERYTFANGTFGAFRAVGDLVTRVRDMRFMRGETVLPLVALSSKQMPTRFGTKIRPEFKIVGWRDAGGNATPRIAPPNDGSLKNVTEPTLAEHMQDEVPH